MKWPLRQVAAWLDAEIEGESDIDLLTISKIEEAQRGSITFLANPKYTSYLYSTQASAVIIHKDFQLQQPIDASLLRVEDPYSAFTKLLQKVAEMKSGPSQGVHPMAFISPTAELAEGVYVGPFAYVGDQCKIGKDAQIFPFAYLGDQVEIGESSIVNPHVTIYHECQVGAKCIIHAGAVIGSDGFGFAPQADGSFKKIPQTGNVILEDGVEIGSNTTIDRATLGSTLVKAGAKIDNLVQLAHNVEVGENSVIAAQSGVAGSTRLGKYVMLGGQVGVVGHLEIADQTKIDAQSGVNRSIFETGKAFRGSPVQEFRQQLKSEVLFRKLEEMNKRIQQLENALESNN